MINRTVFACLIVLMIWMECVSCAKVMVGVAKVDVTPKRPVVLAGYGGRAKPFEGIDTKLWARAMVIGQTDPVAVVSLDNCGLPVELVARLQDSLKDHGILPGRFVIAVTHTHNAPSLSGYAPIVWKGRTSPQEDKLSNEYTEWVLERVVESVTKALAARKPATLEWAQGRVTFGGNRRVLNDGRWAGFGFQRNQPVDHSLPFLIARDETGIVKVIWANYACHCTTVGAINRVGGDWAGFANEELERAFPDCTSLVTIGCGADVGPQPSGNPAIAKKHGASIAVEVRRIIESKKTNRLTAEPSVQHRKLKLPLASPHTVKHWKQESKAGGFHGQRAKHLLEHHAKYGKLPTHVDYPIRVWSFGEDLSMIFLPGEVVVDYSVRLKDELDWRRVWITGWANGVPSYIPSRRVLLEGGYEAEFSQVYYGLPSPYDPKIEDLIVSNVRMLVGDEFNSSTDQEPCPFHEFPSLAPQAWQRLREWSQSEKNASEQATFEAAKQLVRIAQPAFEQFGKEKGQPTEWYDFAGDFSPRRFIRQEQVDAQISWLAPRIEKKTSTVLFLSAGLGWQSQPKTEGFELIAKSSNEKGESVSLASLSFDVVSQATSWNSPSNALVLHFIPTWTSNEDASGFFFIEWKTADLVGKTVEFTVRSAGKDSRRWFAIDSNQKPQEHLKKLRQALLVQKMN